VRVRIGIQLTCIVIAFAAFVALAWPAHAQNPNEFHKTFPLNPGGTVSVNTISGTIRVSSWDENQVKIDAVKTADREQDLAFVDIQVDATPAGITIRTLYTGGVRGGNPRRIGSTVSVNYDIKVPRSAQLSPLISMSGDIQVVGPVAQVIARSTSGSVSANQVTGGAQVTSTSGDVTARRIGGVLVARSISGTLVVEDVDSQATATSNSGDVTVRGAKGDVVANAHSGAVRVERVSGRATARAFSGAVVVSDVDGDVTAESASDQLTIQTVRGRVNATTSSGEIVVKGAQNGVRAFSVSGSIVLYSSKGRLDLTSTSADLQLHDVDSREVVTRNTSGQTFFEGAVYADGRYTFESLSGEITLKVPAQSGFSLFAKTYSGSINTQFPLQLTPGQVAGERQVRGTFGKGGAEITVTSYQGPIQIIKR